MTSGRIYGGREPWDVPAYTLPVAARIVRVPAATLRYWVVGRKGLDKDGTERLPKPLIHIDRGRLRFLSFTNLVEAHVLASMRRKHEISMPEVRKALSFVEAELGIKNPLAKADFRTKGKRLFIEKMSKLIDVTTGEEVAEGLDAGFDRIRYENGLALRFFPYVRGDGELDLDQPKNIEMDSRIAFGRPVIVGTGVPVDEVNQRFEAGDSALTLADEFGVSPDLVEEAIRAARAAA
jgi:uncharacterized protein (DUF433 family)